MPNNRRHDAATATVGLAGVATGASIANAGTERAQRARLAAHLPRRRIPAYALKTHGGRRAKLLYGVGSGMVAFSGAGAGAGLYGLASKRDAKAPQRTFIGEGLAGNADAMRTRTKNLRTGTKDQTVRGVQLVGAIGGGALGSQVGHKTLDYAAHGRFRNVGSKRRAAFTAVGGTVGALGALPVVNHAIRGRGYKVTPTGVVRSKVKIARPTSVATVLEGRPSKASGRFGKRDNSRVPRYPGRDLSAPAKYALLTAAGSVPVAGDFAAGAAAGRMAPPGGERKAAITQAGGSLTGSYGGMAGGALASHKLAAHSPRYARRTQKIAPHITGIKNAGRKLVRLAPKTGKASTAAKVVGGAAGMSVGGQIGGLSAFQLNQSRDRRYKKRFSKLAPAPLPARERTALARRKRRSAVLSQVGGVTGIAALGALAGTKSPGASAKLVRRLNSAQTPLLAVGGGVGGVNAFLGAKVQRKEAAQIAPSRKELASKAFTQYRPTRLPRPPRALALAPHAPTMRTGGLVRRPRPSMPGLVTTSTRRGGLVVKLDTTMSSKEAKGHVARYGLKGTLPHTLDRATRMKAYEARYISAGGPKGEKWGRRKKHADTTLGTAAAVGGLGAGAQLAGMARRKPRLERRAGMVGLAATAAAVPAYLAGRHAEHKQSSYRSAPAGVAAGALRRMRDYDAGS